MAKLKVESVPPPGPTDPLELEALDELLEVLVLELLLELPEHDWSQIEATSETQLAFHAVSQQ
jgi:hypothetical protein